MSDKSSSSGGIGFLGLLTISFIILKLTGFITWSWLWILAPIWIPFSAGVIIILVIAIILKIVRK